MSTEVLTGYAPYDSYKESGVDWLGEIPKQWNILPLDAISKVKSISEYPNETLLSVYLNEGVIRYNDVKEKRTNVTSTNLDHYQLVDKGDFVLNNQQAWRGSVGVSPYRGIVSPAYIILKLSKRLESNFANYIFRSEHMIYQYVIHSKGIGTIQRNLYWQSFKKSICLVPPISEQLAISNFLDDRISKINKAIMIKHRQIEKLNEYKQITIQNAVTKGLNPDVKMKDSGIDWIGNIPEHWEVKKLKYIVKLKSGETFSSDDFLDEGYRVYGGNGFRGYTETYTNDGDYILIGRQGALCGNVNYAYGQFYATEHAIVVYPISRLNLVWMGELIKCANFNRLSTSTAQPGISVQTIKEVFFPYCSLEEQNKIGAFVEKTMNDFEATLSNFSRQIERLKEYKTILINQAVTGKIKVS